MDIIVPVDGLDQLDPAVRKFVEAAWDPPSADPLMAGLRRRNADFPRKAQIMPRAAAAMDEAFAAERDEIIAYDMNPAVDAFATWMYRENPTLRAYRLLIRAWNERSDLGTCQGCGSLILPGKGRIAKYCSDACRMRQNRRPTLQERFVEEPLLRDPDPEKQAKGRKLRAERLREEAQREAEAEVAREAATKRREAVEAVLKRRAQNEEEDR